MPKFRKGDRIEVGHRVMTEHIGRMGTVIEDDTEPYVEFDEHIFMGNDAKGAGTPGRCQAFHEDDLILITRPQELYTFDDLVRAIGTLGLHDKDEFMLLNMIDMIKEA